MSPTNPSLDIRKVRPRLYEVAPLTAYICWVYTIVNVLLGAGMYALYDPTVPLAIANILTYQTWGLIFVGVGVSTFYGLVRNDWKLTRDSQLVGLGVKSIWAIALVYRSIVSPKATILITIIWFLFAAIQAGVYIYFIPKVRING